MCNGRESPSEEHEMKISDVRWLGTVLSFKGSQHAEFEMTIVGAEGARLKFLGTQVGDKPWALKRPNEWRCPIHFKTQLKLTRSVARHIPSPKMVPCSSS
jgi:hypothetical protein